MMMKKLKFLTAGESHGKGLVGILEGLPAGLEITEKYINTQLTRRQQGHGRGFRDGGEAYSVDVLEHTVIVECISPVGFHVLRHSVRGGNDRDLKLVLSLSCQRPGLPGSTGHVKDWHLLMDVLAKAIGVFYNPNY